MTPIWGAVAVPKNFKLTSKALRMIGAWLNVVTRIYNTTFKSNIGFCRNFTNFIFRTSTSDFIEVTHGCRIEPIVELVTRDTRKPICTNTFELEFFIGNVDIYTNSAVLTWRIRACWNIGYLTKLPIVSLLATTTLYELNYYITCSSNYYAPTIQCLILTPVIVTFFHFLSNFRTNTAKNSTKLENTLRFFVIFL